MELTWEERKRKNGWKVVVAGSDPTTNKGIEVSIHPFILASFTLSLFLSVQHTKNQTRRSTDV